jgi:hypothetical protein
MSRVKCPHCHETIIVQVERHGEKEMIRVEKPVPSPNVNINAYDGFNAGEKAG